MANFGIVTISHQRPMVLKLFCAGIKRLRAELNMVIPCVVVGDADHKSICDQYFIHHIAQENHPASSKFNRGVEYMMNLGMEYVVISGSDDLFATNLVTNLIAEMEKGTDLIGINTVYFYAGDGKHRGQMRKLVSGGQILGVARTIHRRVIEKTGKLWTKDRSWAMDGDCLRNILPHCKTKVIVEGDCYDIKNHESLNKMTMWLSRLTYQEDPQRFYSILSKEEKQILSEL